MAIQFRCPGCSQPIEVDDEFALRSAQCPYCRAVVAVPAISSLEIGVPVAARPVPNAGAGSMPPRAEGAPAPALPPIPASRGDARQASARWYGNLSLVATGLTLALMVLAMVRIMVVMAQGGFDPAAAPQDETLRRVGGDALVQAASLGMLFFALVGALLALTSVIQARAGNWRGFVSLAVCGGLLICNCATAVMSALGRLPTP